MPKYIVSLSAGIIFGLGLAVSQMINPQKVLAFLDISGRWDPSLLFVMVGGIAVFGSAYQLLGCRVQPIFSKDFSMPRSKKIQTRLIVGSAAFGVGWALVGFCPGPAISSLALGLTESLVFVASMFSGFILYNILPHSEPNQHTLTQ